jgi:hypothetical protein
VEREPETPDGLHFIVGTVCRSSFTREKKTFLKKYSQQATRTLPTLVLSTLFLRHLLVSALSCLHSRESSMHVRFQIPSFCIVLKKLIKILVSLCIVYRMLCYMVEKYRIVY